MVDVQKVLFYEFTEADKVIIIAKFETRLSQPLTLVEGTVRPQTGLKDPAFRVSEEGVLGSQVLA